MASEFDRRGIALVGLGQEDKDLESAVQILDDLTPMPEFEIAADVHREVTRRYERTTVYLIDERGIVRQIFPMMTHMRATARVLLAEAERLGIGSTK